MAIIKTENLTKKFRELVAVDDVSLEIQEGECFGLLGPNGAGKTSLIRMITAVSPPTSGNISVMGNDLRTHSRQAKAALGIVPQLDNLDPDLSVMQNLIVFSRYFDIPKEEAYRRSLELLKLFELESKRHSQIRELSGGMKRRLLLARSLINLPRILILDEPTIGLDPQGKYLVWHKLAELKSQGITQLLCTQNMEEATVLCDRVAILHQGRILDIGAAPSLIRQHVGDEVWEIDVSAEEKDKVLKELERRGAGFEDMGNKIHIYHGDIGDSVRGRLNSPLKRRPATLEDVFFILTGRSLAE